MSVKESKIQHDVTVKDVEELLIALAHQPVTSSPAFKEQLFEQLVAEMRSTIQSPMRISRWWISFLDFLVPGRAKKGKKANRKVVLGRRRFMPVAIGLAVIASGLLAFALLSQLPSSELAILTVQEGRANVVQIRSTFLWFQKTKELVTPAGQELILREGDRIAVASASRALLTFFEDSTTELAGGTEVTIQTLRPATQDTPPMVVFKVWTGKTVNRVKRLLDPASVFEVETPFLTAAVRGTVFRLEVISEVHTYLATEEGVVNIRLGEQSVDVHAGEEVDAIIGEPLTVRPQQPELSISPANDTVVDKDAIVTSDKATSIQGQTLPGIQLILYINDQEAGRVQADQDGNFQYTFVAPEEGKYRLRVAILGPGSGLSQLSEPVTIIYERSPPPPLTITSPTEPK